ncbi:MAG: CHASE2 domain-containing protein [Pseudobutyrivibrio sp.]|nr:CHASE2 domain-containing protein [Pseudobutyrivibrio sp.]
MKIFTKRRIKKLLIAAVTAGAITLATALGVFSWLDNRLADAVYQRQALTSGKVVVVGIDEKALKAYGPFQSWDRSIMASALRQLASDESSEPAVVAIDTLYSGERGDSSDEELADAASKLNCVVTGASAAFGTTREYDDNGRYIINDYAVLDYEESYDALKAVTNIGHINAMYDSDGVLRHSILYIDNPDGERVYSMAAVTAACYLAKEGKEVNYPQTDSLGRFFVAYTGAPGDFYDGVSIYDLIEGNIDPSYFADKIVFIGPYAAGLSDNVITPISRSKNMYGVEYQANVVEQILAENYKKEMQDWIQLVILFLVTFLALILFIKLKLMPSSFAAIVLLAGTVIYAVILYSNGIVCHPLWLILGVLISYILEIVWEYLRSREEKREITNTFKRYVDSSIVSELLKEGTDALGLSGKSCDIAVLFVDIRGFTTMSEHMDPETIVSILDEYLGMTSECVHRNHGTLDKFVGDCTMAFWGAPLPMDNPMLNAVKCAWDIIEGAEEISKELQERLGVPLHVGVGVNYGPAVVGNIGAPDRMDYTAIGDTVNTAARLEANAPAGQLYISRVVADALADYIECESLGATIKLKGKAEGFEVLSVKGWK